MSEQTEELTGTILEVFIPGPGENPEDPNDMERTLFLGAAQEALDSGVDIEVYSTDSYPSAFEECEPVAEQITRFSKAHKVKKPKVNAAAAACGPSGSSGFTPIPDLAPGALREPAGFAATLAGKKPQVVGGPDIGNRVNLMGGDTGDGIPSEGSVATKSGGCGCGGCGCGG